MKGIENSIINIPSTFSFNQGFKFISVACHLGLCHTLGAHKVLVITLFGVSLWRLCWFITIGNPLFLEQCILELYLCLHSVWSCYSEVEKSVTIINYYADRKWTGGTWEQLIYFPMYDLEKLLNFSFRTSLQEVRCQNTGLWRMWSQDRPTNSSQCTRAQSYSKLQVINRPSVT